MDKEFIDEWRTLQEIALARLQMPTSCKNYSSRLTALILPSFEDNWRFELLTDESQQSQTALAVKTVWHMSSDSSKFANPVVRLIHGPGFLQPTFEQFEAEVDRRLIDDLLAKAATLQVPLLAGKEFIHLDGTSFQLELSAKSNNALFKWWSTPPKGWEPLQMLIEGIVAICG
jgi:hypothetical protein